MKYAEVAVDASIGYDRTLSYSIPPRMEIEPGQMVWVPLRNRPVQGIVFHLAGRPQVEATRDIISPIEPSPLVSPPRLLLARWLSRYYMSSLFDAVALMLPPGFQTRVLSYVSLAPKAGWSRWRRPPPPPDAGRRTAQQPSRYRRRESHRVSSFRGRGQREGPGQSPRKEWGHAGPPAVEKGSPGYPVGTAPPKDVPQVRMLPPPGCTPRSRGRGQPAGG